MGLVAYIYRSEDYDFSRNGLSAHYTRVTIPSVGTAPFDPSPERPSVEIIHRAHLNYTHAQPAPLPIPLGQWLARKTSWMMGGTFIHTSDSRFRQLNAYPIPLHDRTEGAYNPFLAQDIWMLDAHTCFDVLMATSTAYDKARDKAEQQRLRIRLYSFYLRNARPSMITLEDAIQAYQRAVHTNLHTVADKVYRTVAGGYLCRITHTASEQKFTGEGKTPKLAYAQAYRQLRAYFSTRI